MITGLEDAIIQTYKLTRKHLDELEKKTGAGGGMVIKDGVKERILYDFFLAVKTILEKRGVG
jgi:hypothetical protein